MKFSLSFLMVPFCAVLVLAGCEDTAKDNTGFSGNDRLEAMQRGTVLPGMTPDQVKRIWGAPQRKQGEEWIYYTGPVGNGYDVHTSVKFSEGKVSDIMNGDLMAGRDRSREAIPNDLAPDMRRGSGVQQSTGSPSFQSLQGTGGAAPGL